MFRDEIHLLDGGRVALGYAGRATDPKASERRLGDWACERPPRRVALALALAL
jgi:hypothetical protein